MGDEVVSDARPAFYALEEGGWRDYVTLLHLPYTAWHLSYVVIGGCLAPVVAWNRLGAVVAAFALALGIGAHALDELRGRPLRTRIPDSALVALAALSLGAACAIGIVVAVAFEPWLFALIPVGVFLVLAYNLELAGGRFHTDLWFGLAWGGFPVVCGYMAVAGELTGDGQDEILGSAGPDPAATSEVRALEVPGPLTPLGTFTPFPALSGGSHLGAGDMDLDGIAEVAVAPSFLPASPGDVKLFGWDGATFTEQPAWSHTAFPGASYGATRAIGNMGI